MPWGSSLRLEVFETALHVEQAAALEFRSLVSPTAVFGFATGKTPLGIYRELGKHGPLECAAAFSLDEYLGLSASDPNSFAHYVRHRIEPELGLPSGFVHVLDGSAIDVMRECAHFERLIDENPIDLQLLGTGRNGHIAFNEPGSARDSVTRVVDLDYATRSDNGGDFGGLAPEKAITQGVATIMQAKRVLLVATGSAKKRPLAQLFSGVIDPAWPISYLTEHPDLVVLADQAAMD